MSFDLIDSLSKNLDVLLLMLSRLAVQRQLLAILLIALAAEGVADGASRLLARIERSPRASSSLRVRQRLRAVEHTFSPVLALLFIQITQIAFDRLNWQAGLLSQVAILALLLLAYRLVVTVLYAFQPEEDAQYYRQRFLAPIFYFLLFFAAARAFSGIVDLTNNQLFVISEQSVTLGALYRAFLVFYLFLAAGWLLQLVLRRLVFPRVNADQGIRNTILTITQYVMISSAILATLGALGLDLSSLAIIGAGLSVGIGFGLQDLVANFISGILLLFEQSIRPGDVVQIDDRFGMVQKLRIRSTTVRTNDNVEVIVPNQTLLASSVITYTHSDRSVRVGIPVGVSYRSDPQEVRQVLLGAAQRHGLVRKSPQPVVFFLGYGDSSVDFELAVWIDDYMAMRRVTSDLRFIIWEELAKRDIEIPFPQRDLHLRSGVPWDQLLAAEEQWAKGESDKEEPDDSPAEPPDGKAPARRRKASTKGSPSGSAPGQEPPR